MSRINGTAVPGATVRAGVVALLVIAAGFAPVALELGGIGFGAELAFAGNGKKLGGADMASADQLGGLNAAHASANARLHASADSRVGKIALYEALERCEPGFDGGCSSLADGFVDADGNSIMTADSALIHASNKDVSKDGELFEEIRTAINSLLGIVPTTELAPVTEATGE